METKKIRVILADDHTVLRTGLRLLLESYADIEVVGEAPNGTEAVQQATAQRPDVLVLDISMPGANGLSVLEEIRKSDLPTRSLILTMHEEPAYVRSAMLAGAFGYVVKRAADSELVEAIRAVARGRSYVSTDLPEDSWVDAPATASGRGKRRRKNGADLLSMREREVLTLVAHGHTNQEIAQQLGIGVKSVETYRARVSDKLGFRNRAEMVNFALEKGYLRTPA